MNSSQNNWGEYEVRRSTIWWIEVYDFSPAINDPKKNTLLFAPGFSRTAKSIEETMGTFSMNWRRSLTFNHPRIFGEIKKNPTQIEIPKEVLRRASTIYTVFKWIIEGGDNKQIKIDLVWQSAWSIDVILAAIMIEEEFPLNVWNIVLVSPSWMIDWDTFENIRQRYKLQVKENMVFVKNWVDNAVVAFKEAVKYYLQNPVRAYNESKSLVSVDLKDLLNYLKIKSPNILVSVIHWVDDKTYPMEDIQRQKELWKKVAGFYSVKWWHSQLYLNPKVYAEAVDLALIAMNKDRS